MKFINTSIDDMICTLRKLYGDCNVIVKCVESYACRLAKNTVDAHHRHRLLDGRTHGRQLLDGYSAQAMVSSGYEDETDAKEDIHSDLANLLPLESLRRGATMRR